MTRSSLEIRPPGAGPAGQVIWEEDSKMRLRGTCPLRMKTRMECEVLMKKSRPEA
jgi:hypothetical protein